MATKRASSPKRGPVRPRRYFTRAPEPDTSWMKHKGGPIRRIRESVTLRFQHFVATQEYGPGTVRVTPEIAATLREQETRAAQAEAKFRDLQPLATIIYHDGSTRKVSPENFNFMGGA